MTEPNQSDALMQAIWAAVVERDGKAVLPCAAAFMLAGKLGASLSDIGRICNRENIKIVQCQLGCFP